MSWGRCELSTVREWAGWRRPGRWERDCGLGGDVGWSSERDDEARSGVERRDPSSRAVTGGAVGLGTTCHKAV